MKKITVTLTITVDIQAETHEEALALAIKQLQKSPLGKKDIQQAMLGFRGYRETDESLKTEWYEDLDNNGRIVMTTEE